MKALLLMLALLLGLGNSLVAGSKYGLKQVSSKMHLMAAPEQEEAEETSSDEESEGFSSDEEMEDAEEE